MPNNYTNKNVSFKIYANRQIMNKYNNVAALYIATLKVMALIHQHSHWVTRGTTFYGDHILFERLYDSALENLDSAAEKFIGLFGDECLGYDTQADLVHRVLLKYKNLEGSPAEMSLAVEKDFIKFSRDAYECFEKEGKLSLGLDDLIMAISGQREESVYLLQQVLRGK
jgi:DNA-binding ferritin-like protein